MKKIAVIITVLIILAITSAGCGNKSSQVHSGQQGKTEENVRQEDNGQVKSGNIYPLTVVDAKGVEITIGKKPEKIVSLSLSTDEILLSLVDKDRIKAVSYLAFDPGISNVSKEAKEINEKVGTETETIIALGADLIFLSDWQDDAFIQQLRDAHINVYTYKTPSNIEEQRQMVMDIARVVDEVDKGQEIVDWMDEKLVEVEKKVGNLKDEDKLSVINDNFGYTFAKGSMFDDIVKRAGLKNAASEAGMEYFIEITKEKIVELNPDMIVLPSWSFDENTDPDQYLQQIKNDPGLAEVSAVKNDRVVMIPDKHVSAISQYVVLAVEDLARAAYPELFK